MRGLVVVIVAAGCGFEVRAASDGGVAGEDAEASDAAIDQCSSTYTTILAGQASRYRMEKTVGTFFEGFDRCASDGVGSHLVAFDDMTELMALQVAFDAEAFPQTFPFAWTFAWVGTIQLPAQASTTDGWITLTGAPPLPFAAWETGEPNDAGGDNREDGQEQFANIWQDRTHLADIRGRLAMGAICECDGKAITVEFAKAVAGYRLVSSI